MGHRSEMQSKIRAGQQQAFISQACCKATHMASGHRFIAYAVQHRVAADSPPLRFGERLNPAVGRHESKVYRMACIIGNRGGRYVTQR